MTDLVETHPDERRACRTETSVLKELVGEIIKVAVSDVLEDHRLRNDAINFLFGPRLEFWCELARMDINLDHFRERLSKRLNLERV